MGGHRRVNGLEERSSALEMRGAKLPRVGNSGSGSSLGGTSGRCTQAELTDWVSEGGISLAGWGREFRSLIGALMRI